MTPPNECRYCVSSDGGGNSCTPSWGACSVTCGGGTQSDGCGHTRACNTQQCPVDINDFYVAQNINSLTKNATLRQDSLGNDFYVVLAAQMQIYKLPIKWSVQNADACTASCEYRDENGVRLQDGAGQANDCQFRGTMPTPQGVLEVQPQTRGTVVYTLTCTNTVSTDAKSFTVAVKLFSWQEVLRRTFSENMFSLTAFNPFASVLGALQRTAHILGK